MKNSPVRGSSNCWLSSMLPPCSKSRPVTVATMPALVRAGQGEDDSGESRWPGSARLTAPPSGGCCVAPQRGASCATVASVVPRRAPVNWPGSTFALMRNSEGRASALGRSSRSIGPSTILKLLAQQGTLGVTELARELSVHKSTATRLVGALESSAGSSNRSRTGASIGSGQASCGWRGRPRPASTSSARRGPICRDLSASTGETVNLAVLATRSALYIDQVTGHLAPVLRLGRPAHPPARHVQRQGAALRAGRVGGLASDSGSCPPTPRDDHVPRRPREQLRDVRDRGYAVAPTSSTRG